ncbi:MAG: glycerol-3-phosphate dehydrogenase/oxidase [Actinobacteria bacterium]|nr:MAG: glycerol-3-phosphate dehydrogenase/oxidase [Actinomycetota bacterium]
MTLDPTAFDREAALGRLAAEPFDVLVVGGGVTGAGVALDAAARGLSTALVERGDLASGTSSKSSKLIHGGLRYLQQREYLLVYENLAERQLLLHNAPHLVSPLPFLIPLFGRDGVVNKAVARAYSVALWLYDLTGGLRIGKRHRRIGVDETLAHMPTLRPDRLVAGFVYYDAEADDARLTLTLARTAALDFGAAVATYAPVTGFHQDGSGRVDGAVVSPLRRPGTGGATSGAIEVRASVVVNAAGVWADQVRGLEEGAGPGRIRPAKGIHVAVRRDRLPCDLAVVLPVPKDRRSIFVIPWGPRVYVGTTDTDYDGSLDEPRCTPADVAYLLGALNTFVSEPVSEADVVGAWAGLRPLIKDATSERTADLSRRHQVSVSDGGLVSVTGGKLTTYRKMASDTVDEVVRRLGRGRRRSPTRHLRLVGAEGTAALGEPGAAERLGADPEALNHLVRRYGGEARALLAMVERDPTLGLPLVPGLPYLAAEAVYGARYEMARTLEDVLSRRTRALLLDRDAAAEAAPAAARLLAAELGWDEADVEAQVAAFRALVDAERDAAGLSTSTPMMSVSPATPAGPAGPAAPA